MREIIKPALVLLAICVAVAAMLAFVFNVTKPVIAERAAADLAAAKLAVLPMADDFTDVTPLPSINSAKPGELQLLGVSLGKKGGKVVGLVVTSLSQGYDPSGVNVTVGVNVQGTVTGVRIGDQKETPGLGSRALDLNGDFMKQFVNLTPKSSSTGSWIQLVKNKPAGAPPEQIDAVSGATFSSRAVTRAVEAALEAAHAVLTSGGQS